MKTIYPISSGGKPIPAPPPDAWQTWYVAILCTVLRASEGRIRRLETINSQLARELDRQRREGGERRRAA
jgi:hypothetical protein